MRRYLISLAVVVALLEVAALVLYLVARQYYVGIMPAIPLYFGAVMAALHYIVLHSMSRSPRAFVQIFLGSTVGSLLLHIAVMVVYIMTHLDRGSLHMKAFLLAFLVGFIVCFAFETTALVRHVDRMKRTRNNPPSE